MKRILLLLIILSCGVISRASHIIGGEMSYKYISKTNTDVTYQVTLKLFRVCLHADDLAELPSSVYFSVFSKVDNSSISGSPFLVSRTNKEEKTLGQIDPCIVNPPTICFQIGTYSTNITVPINSGGYTVSFQTCCRDYSMDNIVDTHRPNDLDNYPGNGATYFTELPGSTGILTNSSPVSAKDEAVLVCAGKKFTYDFSATDIDGDSLSYVLCQAYGGGQPTPGKDAIPPAAIAPPYSSVPYQSPYTGSLPLGANAFIDSKTGIISGIAPPAGKYVVTVCVYEYRNGVLLGIHRKDFHMNVTTCIKEVEAAMPDKYSDCSGYTVTFLNNSTEGKTYDWDFGDGSTLTTQSTDPIPHTYTADGTYTVKLYVDKTSNCGDSAKAIAYVYPLLKPAVSISGFCSNTITTFNNTSTTSGAGDVLNYYRWDFGVTSTLSDTSLTKSPQFKYPGAGSYQVVLLLRTKNGCERYDTSNILVYDSPPLFTTGDTLLCIRNSLSLFAQSTIDGNVVNGTYAWTPNYNITGANTATPVVTPKKDTVYKVTFTDGTGCTNTKSIAVDVRDTLLVRTIADSTICTGDEVHIRAFPDGNYPLTWYNIDNNTQIDTGRILTITPDPPVAVYMVQGNLGDCSGSDIVQIKLVDPPIAYAGEDTTICYGEQVFLHASGGSSYQWTPTFTLSTPSKANTTGKPQDTTSYVVYVTDILGCPKTITDTVTVNVVPQVPAFAGNDTIVILNKPFQLHATGGATYVWSPVDGLDDPAISNPVTTINHDFTYTVTAYTIEGCSGKDDIFVRFIAGPDIYIPTGFTPNGDGKNDIFRPLPVGIVQLEFFRVYDRWGKLMYSTNEYLKGWDGYYNGQPAAVAAYVWVVQGKNINNETVLRKGTVTLIR
ncbi:gliding motility-associated C-terminal domain-containing protein [Chitinophaga sp. CF118]|uniref:PKD domain-containing protein n=1 Tax=Chitinophaga sp. CF118 TaxID=1884367 RepID=UPI0008E70722|nr:PKD domain-containing protein [Chitinophaga sp. CF118]SFD12219.1 gliding motility-associated C-terminal domain-containing protein [Chitinophaga sp. CF118]